MPVSPNALRPGTWPRSPAPSPNRLSNRPSCAWNFAPMNACASSNASAEPMMRAPSTSTFMSSCSTPWCAEYVSWQIPARIPGILFAATQTPTPRAANQNSPRRHARLDRLAYLLGKVGIVIPGIALVRSQVDYFVRQPSPGWRALVPSNQTLHDRKLITSFTGVTSFGVRD